MGSLPEISIVTPTKNRRALLWEALGSIRAQTCSTWEVIIVDDGSDDGTAEEVRQYTETEPRIRYYERSGIKSGANVCRNQGIRQSRAELILLLDSDDLLRPTCIERRVEIMRRNTDLDFAVFRAGAFESIPGDLARLYHSQSYADDLMRFLSLECPWQTSGPVWRKSFLDKIGDFDESLLSMQDLELHVRAICARGKYICFPDVDHDIRWEHDFLKTSARHFHDPSYIEASESVRAKLLDTVKNSGLLTWSRERAILGLCFGASESWLRAGRLKESIRAWNRGCREYNAPRHLQVAGVLLLCARGAGTSENGFCSRLINKWKGWARFRQEPALLRQPSPSLDSQLSAE